MKLKIIYLRGKNFLQKVNIIAKYTRKNPITIIVDYFKLYSQRRITITEYHDFELEKQDELFRSSFLGINEQRFYLDYLNPKKYYTVARNKYLTHKVLEKSGIMKTKLYCYYTPEGSSFYSNKNSNSEIANNVKDVIRILKDKEVSSCIIKPTEGYHGRGILLVSELIHETEHDIKLRLYNNTYMMLSSLIKDRPYIFESVVQQTKQFQRFNTSSVNTIRFITALYPDGKVKILASKLKIGLEGRVVDNQGLGTDGGNINAIVDIDSGKINSVTRFIDWRNIRPITHHPDSGVPIDGGKVENWEYIKSCVKGYQSAFPWLKLAGWDIAITDIGPVVIEINDFWGHGVQFFINEGLRYKIRECYLAWQKTGMNYTFERLNNNLSNRRLDKIAKSD